jgi:hypothetical protein
MHLALSENPRCCLNAQWPVNNPVTRLRCLLSKVIRSLDSLSEGLPVKNFDCVIFGTATECSECVAFNHSLTLSLPVHGEIEIAGLGSRNELLDHSIAQATTSILTRDTEEPNLVKSLSTQCLSTFSDNL